MICETCHGKGTARLFTRPDAFGRSVTGLCPTCGGFGISHCCDGEQAQPECSIIAKAILEGNPNTNGTEFKGLLPKPEDPTSE